MPAELVWEIFGLGDRNSIANEVSAQQTGEVDGIGGN